MFFFPNDFQMFELPSVLTVFVFIVGLLFSDRTNPATVTSDGEARVVRATLTQSLQVCLRHALVIMTDVDIFSLPLE